jgi:hypothetical protein
VGNNVEFASTRSAAIDRRSRRISQLLPLVSLIRHAQSPAMREFSAPLQLALRDLERLNEIELNCVQATDHTGPSLWMRITKILETP